jgi:tripartite-type tricarboxylate transporter receptor subunit TctC
VSLPKTFIVGQAAGGGYDTHTHTIARETRNKLMQN